MVKIAVFIGFLIALGLTVYNNPHIFNYKKIPLPDIIITSPKVESKVQLTFRVSGVTKNIPVPISVTNSQNQTIYSSTIKQTYFLETIDLNRKALPGDKIYLHAGPPTSPILIPLTIE